MSVHQVQIWPKGVKRSKEEKVIEVEATSMEEAEKKAIELGKKDLGVEVEAFVWN